MISEQNNARPVESSAIIWFIYHILFFWLLHIVLMNVSGKHVQVASLAAGFAPDFSLDGLPSPAHSLLFLALDKLYRQHHRNYIAMWLLILLLHLAPQCISLWIQVLLCPYCPSIFINAASVPHNYLNLPSDLWLILRNAYLYLDVCKHKHVSPMHQLWLHFSLLIKELPCWAWIWFLPWNFKSMVIRSALPSWPPIPHPWTIQK